MGESGAIPAEAMEALRKVGTGIVIDALAMAGIQGGIMGIRPGRGFEDARIVGPASTALFTPAHPDNPKMSNYGAVGNSQPGNVLVFDGGGVDGHLAGDNLTAYAKARGLAGMVVNGGIRDLVGMREVGLPVYSRGTAPRNPGLQASAYNVPISIGGVLVKPGDIIVGDEDGVAAIPANALATVMENIKTILAVEAEMEKAIKANASPEEIAVITAKKKPRK